MPIFRNFFETRISGENSRRGLRSPTLNAWEPVCAIPNQSEVVRNGSRRNPELGNHPGFIAHCTGAAIKLDHASVPDALAEILVWRADEDPPDTCIMRGLFGSRSQCVISFVVGHGPDSNSHGLQCFLKDWKLRKQF